MLIHRKQLNALAAVNHHLRTVDEAALVTGKIEAHVGNVIRISQAAQRHVPNELLSVLRSVFHPGEHAEQPGSREQWRNAVDPDVVRAVLGSEALGGLNARLVSLDSLGIGREREFTFVTAPLEALYHTRPGRGRLAPVEEMLIIDPPFPCSTRRGITILPAK